jgi:hypothetical protein
MEGVMQTAELSAKLREWCEEYGRIIDYQLGIPDGLYPFLANRLVEAGIGEDDPDVVRARLSGDSGYRKVRITGTRGGHLTFEHLDSNSFGGLVTPQQVHDNERGKLGQILEQMAQDGRIPS